MMTQLEVAPTRPPRFAVVSTWPTTENAEYEYIQRIRQAAQSIGAECLIIDEQGYILDIFDERIHENEHRLSFDDIDFVIYLHYFSPKLIDCYSYFALWNPAEFFVMHGYTEHTQRLAMHDDFLHIESPAINRHVTRALRQYDRWIEPSLILHTTCSGPILAPAGGNLSFFYCGINWERINGRPSRYDRLLRKLQETGLLAIFGPKEVQGKDVWSDFHCYRGPIPFDGTSIIYAINSCGISLVLNSLQHQLCAAQSNRLFESLAAGAIIVTHCDSELFEVFGDTLFYLDSVDQDRMFDEIMEHFRWIETHPDEAREKAR
ncbi:MAG: glycosyltransferase, partial [Betaproteobacteria bacterium]|nr:glycosyltransferase [Betaproteobacteria bacterium]